MPKKHLKLDVRLPAYQAPRNKWRRAIHAEVLRELKDANLRYSREDRLEIQIGLYLGKNSLQIHDVDNRLKDIMDALQGRAGGPKSKHRFRRIIQNDAQVYRVVIEKSNPPRQARGRGHLTIRKYAHSR